MSVTKASRWVDLVGKIQAILLGSRLFYQLESRSSAERVDRRGDARIPGKDRRCEVVFSKKRRVH